MPNIHKRPPWWLPDLRPTDEAFFLDRRRFMASLGIGGAALIGGIAGCDRDSDTLAAPKPTTRPAATDAPTIPQPDALTAAHNDQYTLDREITKVGAVTRYVNYYEFSAFNKPRAVRLAQNLTTDPWTLSITGLVKKPKTFNIDELEKRFSLEERLYRHRCVETWAMALPWIGFPLRKLIKLVEPLSAARFVRFVTFMRPEEAPGQRPGSGYPWPYHEGLRMDEANSELAFLAVGAYGRRLTKQNGAPIRLVTPWKYGYKSIKAIVEMQFVDKQPPTFWNTVNAREYGFYSNVDPAVPHPRWSQAQEWMIDGGQMNKRTTLPYNGYGELVADMYAKQ